MRGLGDWGHFWASAVFRHDSKRFNLITGLTYMFDIGFSELILIGVVALIVIGPERLPKVARTAGHLFGRLQRYVNSVKADISREMQLDELRKAGQTFKESVESSARGLETKASAAEYTIRDEVVAQEQAAV